MRKTKIIKTYSIIFLLAGCTSPGYECPLHDYAKSCLSELQAYQASLAHSSAISTLHNVKAVKAPPYIVNEDKVHLHRSSEFSWRGKLIQEDS